MHPSVICLRIMINICHGGVLIHYAVLSNYSYAQERIKYLFYYVMTLKTQLLVFIYNTVNSSLRQASCIYLRVYQKTLTNFTKHDVKAKIKVHLKGEVWTYPSILMGIIWFTYSQHSGLHPGSKGDPMSTGAWVKCISRSDAHQLLNSYIVHWSNETSSCLELTVHPSSPPGD